MELKREGGLTVVTLSERNLAELADGVRPDGFPGLTKVSKAGTLMVIAEPDAIHYARTDGV